MKATIDNIKNISRGNNGAENLSHTNYLYENKIYIDESMKLDQSIN